ncbi:glycosyltransferase family 4 protein [Cellulophaga sp. HaHaR_3_176]|uniref:glycosyltransferase family 4 protein n=1 Tax=Cellulophaga sp. HaHaR_3_176 TaxID=1942464 RepID=UPI001C1FB02E|nr:glycosyltransferase family 1 protein [Cellulophaga sp. HaHaR_3_176]QWX83334.1 glycosyltransferase family 4 protein [Cellulophaga sp. HaHaR_3_176]
MKINYFFRHPKVGHSIQRVFRTLIDEINKSTEVSIFEVPSKSSMPWDILENSVYVYKKRDKKAVHHVTGHIHDVLLALIGVKTVLTIHDLVFIDNSKNPIKRFYKWLFWLYLPIKIANKVVCISNQTKENILGRLKTDKLVVIYNAVDPSFTFSEKNFNKSSPVILHVGTGWNKNLEKTIKALADIPCHLRIVGKLKESQLHLLQKYNLNYSNGLNLTDKEIKKEYENCDIVNFPSVYEGFGMPIIEGQQTGRIVITSKIEPMLEVANEAAIFVVPDDENSLRQAYLKAIQDDAFRDTIIKKGYINAQRFSVTNISNQYLELYKKLLQA